MLDVDGMLYQTVDLKERTHHATITNTDSIGIEIANMGAYPINGANPFDKWYRKDEVGTRLVLPRGALRDENFIGRPVRNDPVVGVVQGSRLVQYDLTKQQYDALIKLTAALVKLFPKIKLDYPKDSNGNLITKKLSDEDILKYEGIMGHFHVSTSKVDPGPAFQWDYVIKEAKKLNEKK
jgi:N-acetylmuramoyl-L-alanine amidase